MQTYSTDRPTQTHIQTHIQTQTNTDKRRHKQDTDTEGHAHRHTHSIKFIIYLLLGSETPLLITPPLGHRRVSPSLAQKRPRLFILENVVGIKSNIPYLYERARAAGYAMVHSEFHSEHFGLRSGVCVSGFLGRLARSLVSAMVTLCIG